MGGLQEKSGEPTLVSKAALEAVSDILCQELKEYNIIVNTVNPGGTATKMRKEAYPREDQSQLPKPIDIIPIISYLASDRSYLSQGINLMPVNILGALVKSLIFLYLINSILEVRLCQFMSLNVINVMRYKRFF